MSLTTEFNLGEWSVLPSRGELVGPQGTRRLQPKVMEVLLCLAESAPEVVAREQLLATVWKRNPVSDEPLTRCIGELRRQLGDNRDHPQYVETIPKRGYRLLIAREPAAGEEPQPAAPPPEPRVVEIADRSLAVMPFSDLSANRNQDYFVEALADEILTALAGVPNLKVAARTSSFKLRDQCHNTIRSQLGVRFVLEGTVKRYRNRVRVNVQLIDTNDGFHRYSESFDKSDMDTMQIQAEIARSIFDYLPVMLEQALPQGQVPNWNPQIPPKVEVYDLYLRGLHAFNKRDLLTATDYLKRACELDTQFAPARAIYASILAVTPHYCLSENPAVTNAEAERLARHALELDPRSVQARAALAMVFMSSYRWRSAERQFLEAIATNPRDAHTRHWYGLMLLYTGRTADAKTQLDNAHRLDPLSPVILRDLGMACYAYGLPKLAENHLAASAVLDPDGVALTNPTVLGAILLEQGRYAEALAAMQSDSYIYQLPPSIAAHIVEAVSRYRKTGEPQPLPEDLEARIVSPGMAGRLYALAGHFRRAIDCLRRGFQNPDLWVMFAKVDPAFTEALNTAGGTSLMAARLCND